MRAIAAGLFAIALAIVILAGVILSATRPVPRSCVIGGGSTGLPPITVDCSAVP